MKESFHQRPIAAVGAIPGGKVILGNGWNRMDVSKKRSQYHGIKNGDVLLTHIGCCAWEKPQFDAVREMEDDPDFYKYALGVTYKIPSKKRKVRDLMI